MGRRVLPFHVRWNESRHSRKRELAPRMNLSSPRQKTLLPSSPAVNDSVDALAAGGRLFGRLAFANRLLIKLLANQFPAAIEERIIEPHLVARQQIVAPRASFPKQALAAVGQRVGNRPLANRVDSARPARPYCPSRGNIECIPRSGSAKSTCSSECAEWERRRSHARPTDRRWLRRACFAGATTNASLDKRPVLGVAHLGIIVVRPDDRSGQRRLDDLQPHFLLGRGQGSFSSGWHGLWREAVAAGPSV